MGQMVLIAALIFHPKIAENCFFGISKILKTFNSETASHESV